MADNEHHVQFPIPPSEMYELAAGLFAAMVGERYFKLLDEAPGLPETDAAKHRVIERAIRDIAAWFPLAIRKRFEDNADHLAAQFIGGAVVFPDRRK